MTEAKSTKRQRDTKICENLYQAGDYFRVHRRHRVLPRHAAEDDLSFLLTTFASYPRHDMKDFLEAWKALDFGQIHTVCTDSESRPKFMQAFYDAALAYLWSGSTVIRIGVFYALYFLYYSQPLTWPRAPIRVEPDTWKLLISTCADFAKSKDAFTVKAAAFLLRLRKDNGFVYTLQSQIETTNHLERMEMESVYTIRKRLQEFEKERLTLDPTSVAYMEGKGRKKLRSTADAYEQAKRASCSGPQATRAMQDLLYNMTGTRETKPERLTGALMNTTLMADEAAFVNTLQRMEAEHWRERFREIHERMNRDKSGRLDSRTRLLPSESPTTTISTASRIDVTQSPRLP
ncbi:small nuclear RNA activating complex, subunit SNAP43-domain-containing protein [Syncephalastrum racemosum]|uniref:Small nuclear RNA activating complex, subunit SNAP43-domain-containing protein n=1 Tax=Syncephalastrum racemosum TaxID=13706 RepID=A0A1X2HHV9_SYNRA|nr:small nuclear RNA activating complex, subunit SNAP43-domain-containing protein [Syncephalastrum racemosum]